MTLRKFINNLPDSDMVYSLAAQNGEAYYFIGTKKEIKKKLSAEYQKQLKKLRGKIASNINLASYHFHRAELCENENEKAIHTDVAEECNRRVNKFTNDLNDFTPYYTREVIETFPRSLGGIAIVTEGADRGDYWLYEEVKERKKK